MKTLLISALLAISVSSYSNTLCVVAKKNLAAINEEIESVSQRVFNINESGFSLEFVHDKGFLIDTNSCHHIQNRGSYPIFRNISAVSIVREIEKTEAYTEADRGIIQKGLAFFGLNTDEKKLHTLTQKSLKVKGLKIAINDGYADDIVIIGFTSEQLERLKYNLGAGNKYSFLLDTSFDRSYNTNDDIFTSYKHASEILVLDRITGKVESLENY